MEPVLVNRCVYEQGGSALLFQFVHVEIRHTCFFNLFEANSL